MESRINKKITFYVNDMKDGIINQMKIMKDSTLDIDSQYDTIMSYVVNYKLLLLHKEDFNKRKRNKNVVNDCEKCKAKRSNGEQCSRRRREGFDFCGTHCKGTPYGIIGEEENRNTKQKCELIGEDIDGIITYKNKEGLIIPMEQIIEN
jgi:hypothetical protein